MNSARKKNFAKSVWPKAETLSICVRAQTKPTLEHAAKDEAILKADRFRNIVHRASWNRQACSGFVSIRSSGPPRLNATAR